MKRPSFQFYPADWRTNAKLRRCSEAARGAWVDVLCVLHDSDEYGVCRWPLADIAKVAGVPLRLLKELASKGVLKGADKDAAEYVYTPRHAGKDGEPVTLVRASSGPCWYCSRFVRDEWVRSRRGDGTRFTNTNQPTKGDDNSPPKGGFGEGLGETPKGGFGATLGERLGDGPSSSSSSSIKKEKDKPPLHPPLPGGSEPIPTDSASDGQASPKPRRFDAAEIDLPPWLDPKDWRDWAEDRRKRGKPISEAGAKRQLKRLDDYRQQGFSPHEIIENSIAAGYQGLFPGTKPAGAKRHETRKAEWFADLYDKPSRHEIDMGKIVEVGSPDDPKILPH